MVIYLAFPSLANTQLSLYIQPIKPKQIEHILSTTTLKV